MIIVAVDDNFPVMIIVVTVVRRAAHMHIVVAPVDYNLVMSLTITVVMMPRHTTFMHGAMDVNMVIVSINDNLAVMTVMRRATIEAFIWKNVRKRTALDFSHATWCTTAKARVECTAMHVNIIVISIDNNFVMTIVVVVVVMALPVRYAHDFHVAIHVVVVVCEPSNLSMMTVVSLVPYVPLESQSLDDY